MIGGAFSLQAIHRVNVQAEGDTCEDIYGVLVSS